MSLEAAFANLVEKFAGLEQACDNMVWAVVQGQPSANWSHALVDFYEASSNDLSSTVKEGRAAAAAGQAATSSQLDLQAARNALRRCHERHHQALLCFYDGPYAFERRSALHDLAARGPAWATWVSGVDDALARCPAPLYAVGDALFGCWQDLVDRASLLSVSAQASFGSLQISFVDEPVAKQQPTT
jgi:hypothetical protein